MSCLGGSPDPHALDKVGRDTSNKVRHSCPSCSAPRRPGAGQCPRSSGTLSPPERCAHEGKKTHRCHCAGDIHDISKNIVKTMLGNYSYEVLDLGPGWPRRPSARTVREQGVRLVGLSALMMTTTLPAMEKTIQLLHTMEEPRSSSCGRHSETPNTTKQMNADLPPGCLVGGESEKIMG